jgi:type III secretion system FlhB-like substrate exporter
MTTEELREFAPDLPAEQFAALTRADVVIVNPDHISMVIQFDHATGTATVVAKGGDELALQIQSVARNAGIPIVQNPELAQALYAQVAVGQVVPEPFLSQIAQIMAELSAAPPAAGLEAGFVGEPVGYQPFLSPNLLIGAGIIGAGIAIPVALANDDEPVDQRESS